MKGWFSLRLARFTIPTTVIAIAAAIWLAPLSSQRLEAAPPGFTPSSQPPSDCFVDTSQADFTTDVAAVNCDLTSTPGSVKLALGGEAIDQQNTTTTTSFAFSNIVWGGQTFTAGVSGTLTKAELRLFCAGCTGTPPNLTVAIRAVNAGTGLPTGADLTTATIPGFSSATPTYYTATFGTPLAIVSGTVYAIVFRSNQTEALPNFASYAMSAGAPNPYAAGNRVIGSASGGSWSIDASSGGRDLGFKIYVSGGYAATGTFTSSLKDSNPGPGQTTTWGFIGWNSTVPAGTTLKFQVAASNNAGGPFNYVGPDGTPATFFLSGAPLSQFDGLRYLRYRAEMTSTGAATPVIQDVSLCFTLTSPKPWLDLNGDGNGDVFSYNQNTGAWKRALSQANGTFAEANGSWDPNWTVAAARFNDDAFSDIFLFNTTSGQWFRMLSDGANGFTTQATGTWWPGWQRFVMDLNGDGLSDVFLYDSASGVWFKAVLSPGDFTYSQGGWNPDWEITQMALNDDTFGDLFLMNRTTGRWFWVLGQAGAEFSYPVTEIWFPGWSFYPGDFNGDERADMLLHHAATGNYFVAMNTGAGFSYTSGTWSLGWTPYVADLNGDGLQDLFLHAADTGQWFQMISGGAGDFSNEGGQTWSLGWNIYATELNGDERTDFLLYHPTTGVWYQALNLVPGTFSYTTGTWSPNLTVVVRMP